MFDPSILTAKKIGMHQLGPSQMAYAAWRRTAVLYMAQDNKAVHKNTVKLPQSIVPNRNRHEMDHHIRIFNPLGTDMTFSW